MSEFKFACPVCGQHITSGASASGTQIECPTCFLKIIVPQAPVADSKYILTATQAERPRNGQVDRTQSGPTETAPASKSSWLAGVVLVLILLAGAVFAAYRTGIFKAAPEQTDTEATSTQAGVGGAASAQAAAAYTNWTLSLAEADFPVGGAFGGIHGRSFTCQRATLQNGILSLRQPRSFPPELEFAVFFFTRQSEALGGQSFSVSPDQARSPRVSLKWKDDASTPKTQVFTNGYAMKIEFGDLTNSNRMSGKIYLCLPDDTKSFVAGSFEADVKKNTPPKPRPPKPPKPPV